MGLFNCFICLSNMFCFICSELIELLLCNGVTSMCFLLFCGPLSYFNYFYSFIIACFVLSLLQEMCCMLRLKTIKHRNKINELW